MSAGQTFEMRGKGRQAGTQTQAPSYAHHVSFELASWCAFAWLQPGLGAAQGVEQHCQTVLFCWRLVTKGCLHFARLVRPLPLWRGLPWAGAPQPHPAANSQRVLLPETSRAVRIRIHSPHSRSTKGTSVHPWTQTSKAGLVSSYMDSPTLCCKRQASTVGSVCLCYG
jgi:hypothetical protein